MTTPLDAVSSPPTSGSATPAAVAGLAVDPATVAIAATFTADGLRRPLEHMLETAGLSMDVDFAPYNQVFQEFLSPRSTIGRNAVGTNVVLLRLEDFVRDAAEGSDRVMALDRVAQELLDAAQAFVQRAAVPTWFVLMPLSPANDAARAAHLAQRTDELAAGLGALANAAVILPAEIDALCPTERFDDVSDRLAHIPYTDDYLAALAIVLARRLHRERVAAHKVLVLDCDNTIWRGVVGEDGPAGIGLDDAFLAVQRFAVEAQAQGALVCLASKNAEADVMEVFDTRADMVLSRSHIVAHRIDWNAKPSNLRSLARELNLGLDAFVFLDDNPVECGAMLEVLPEVVTLQLPPPDDVPDFLRHLWAFDKTMVTQEDLRRTEMYRQNAARDSLEASADDIGEFLASLALKIDIAPPRPDEWPRVAQLTHRTNQFNFTTRRRTEPEMRELQAAGSHVLAVHVSDRFGDYGLVGVLVAQAGGDVLSVDTFLLSCRVLGRGVEHAMVVRLGELALEAGAAGVHLPLQRTAKNEPAFAFANSILLSWRSGAGSEIAYDVPAATAAAVRHRAGEDAAEVVAARRDDGKKAAKPAAQGLAGRSSRYAELARLNSGAALMATLRARSRVAAVDRPAVAPGTDTERALLPLWEEILGLTAFGVEDDWFALGGTSLQAARMVAELSHRHGVALPLTSIVEAPTLRAFAARVDQARDGAARTTGLVAFRDGGRRTLFLVHDGDGETLLYRNLANRLPADLRVYGIQPQSRANIPLVHMTIEEMASAYVELVRAEQPSGPYLLGGMCAGGLIAYEMAQQFERAGEAVEQVLLLDAATPDAARRPGPGGQARSSRLRQAIASARAGRGAVGAALATTGVVVAKSASAATYELGKKLRRWQNQARMALLARVLRSDKAWPVGVPGLDFRAIYNHAERLYRPLPTERFPVVLLRAQAGTGSDMPYVQLYEDPTLGWSRVLKHLRVADVEGGHSSMLQEPHAEALARVLLGYIPGQAPAGVSSASRVEHAV